MISRFMFFAFVVNTVCAGSLYPQDTKYKPMQGASLKAQYYDPMLGNAGITLYQNGQPISNTDCGPNDNSICEGAAELLNQLFAQAGAKNENVYADLEKFRSVENLRDAFISGEMYRKINGIRKNAKLLTLWGFTNPTLPNRRFELCVTANFAKGKPVRLCPGVSTDANGQFTQTLTFLSGSLDDDEVRSYSYELYSNEMSSPYAPYRADLFGPAEMTEDSTADQANEQHANIEYRIN